MNMDIKDIPKSEFLNKLPGGFIGDLPQEAGIYAVGGSVRDAFLPGIIPRELDLLISQISPQNLLKTLNKYGKARLVGRSFSVIKWTPQDKAVIDVSMPAIRDRLYENGCKIDPNYPLEDDLAQRDFTVDAMALDLRTGELIDPFGGKSDLKNGLLRVVSEKSVEADPIRCIRAAYICTRCRLKPEKATQEKIEEAVLMLDEVAPERIGEELKKLLVHLPEPSHALRLWEKWGILEIVIPELAEGVGVIQEGGWHAHDVFEHGLHAVDAAPPNLEIRLAALLHDIGKPRRKRFDIEREKATFYGHQNVGEKLAERILKRLKFSNDTVERVSRMVRFHMFTRCETDKGVRRFIRKVGEDLLDDLFELRFADIEAQGTGRENTRDREYYNRIMKILDEEPALRVTDLAIDGEDVMEHLGIDEGVEVGKALDYLLQQVDENPELNSREKLFHLLYEYKTEKKLK